MTTIAVKDGVVAYDSRISCSGEIFPGHADKAWVSQKHQAIFVAAGAVGLWHEAMRAIENYPKLPWYTNKWRPDHIPELDKTTWVMVIERDGSIYNFEGQSWYRCPTRIVAIGSGSMAARAAMMCGKSAAEAVEVAIQLDSGSGPPVNVLRLEDIPQPVKRRARRRRR